MFQISNKIMDSAFTASLKSNFTKQPMGCIVFKGKKVVSEGYNYVYGSGRATIHAEAFALENLARRHGLLSTYRHLISNYSCSLKAKVRPQCRKDRTL